MSTTTGLTIDEFENLPDCLAEQHELVDGELVDVSGNIPIHNLLRDLLTRLLAMYVEEHKLGLVLSEQEFQFGENAHGPDLSFIAAERRGLLNKRLRVQRFVPDLAVEIVSNNDTYNALMNKVQRYLQCGTSEAWVFSIECRQVQVHSKGRRALLGDDDEFAPAVIPGFSIRIGELFDRVESI